jgi:hypothetical protein
VVSIFVIFAFLCGISDLLIPEGLAAIAQRFNVGSKGAFFQVPKGTAEFCSTPKLNGKLLIAN